MEDYWLFARMIAAGARVVNVSEPLVYYRVGDGAYQRRGGRDLLRSELRLQREMRREGFITGPQYWRNVVVRGGYRLVPTAIRKPFYRAIVATYGDRRNRERDAKGAAGAAPAAPADAGAPDKRAYVPRHARPPEHDPEAMAWPLPAPPNEPPGPPPPRYEGGPSR